MRLIFTPLLVLSLLPGCESNPAEPREGGARTSYGQAVEKARGVDLESNRRDDELKRQAEELTE